LGLAAMVTACKAGVKEARQEPESFVIHRGVNISHWLSQTEIRGEERAKYM
jgi:hypothetical protein